MTGRRFRPPLWAWLGYVPLMALLLALGSWQWQRGTAKLELDADARTPPVTVPWTSDLRSQLTPAVRARVTGHYRAQSNLLLDNQTHERRPGYHLWSVVVTDAGEHVVVSRGWVPLHLERDVIPSYPAPSGPQILTGVWRPLPRPGMTPALPDCQAPAALPVIVQYPQIETLRCFLGLSVADGVLLLDPQSDDIGVRDWSLTAGVPATRHFGYAAQWWVFALVLTFFFVSLNLRKAAHE